MNFSFFQLIFPIKILTLIVFFFYIVFTFIIFTQIQAMSKIIDLPHATIIFKIIILINMALAVSLFLFAIVIL